MKNIPIEKRKYRKSIIEGMDEKKIPKYGFEKSYMIFERSINRLAKSGDAAEEMALAKLKEYNLLSDTYRCNQVITLGNIRMEMDIIDYDNKIAYEVKSRRQYQSAKVDIIKKFKLFEYDKINSPYKDYKFKGIIYLNSDGGSRFSKILEFENKKINRDEIKKKMDKYFIRLKELKKIERDPNYKEDK